MDRRHDRVFIDTNMLFFAAQYKKENIFTWFNKLYGNIWIHVDVLNEMLTHRVQVQNEIDARRWHLFDPSVDLSDDELIIYNIQIDEIKEAFQRLNEIRRTTGKRVKNTANTGEISTLAVCLIEDAHLICSNDFDVRDVVKAEKYTYIDKSDNQEHLIVQDTAEDFCYHCVVEASITKSKVRHFYKTIFDNIETRNHELSQLDTRLNKLS